MKVPVKTITFAGALCLLTAATAAADGVQIVMKVTSEGGPAQTSQVQIDGKRMRAEGFGDRGEKQIAAFDGSKKVMMLIDEAKKTYTEMTAADIESLSSQLEAHATGGMQMFSVGSPADQGFSGVPVRSLSTVGGRQVTSEITDITRQAFPESSFQAPAGYQKQSMMDGRGRGDR